MITTLLSGPRKRPAAALAIGLLVLAVGCDTVEPRAVQVDEGGPTFTLDGRIFDAETGEAVADAHVHVAQRAPGTSGITSTTTDADGYFRVAGLRGRVTVRASKDGYEIESYDINMDGDQTLDFRLDVDDGEEGDEPGLIG